MGDPTRLLSARSDADGLERALLESLHDEQLSEDAKAAIWRGVSTGVAALTVAGASAAAGGSAALASSSAGAGPVAASSGALAAGAKASVTGALASAAGALLPKALVAKVVLAVALGGAGAGGIALWNARAPQAAHERGSEPTRSSPVLAPVPPLLPTHAARVSEAPATLRSRAEPRASTLHARAQPRASTRRQRDLLAAESELVTSVRAALRRGDTHAASQSLARLASSFAHGELLQEREVLEIELLSALGDRAAARARARAFIARHPESPHSPKLQRFLD